MPGAGEAGGGAGSRPASSFMKSQFNQARRRGEGDAKAAREKKYKEMQEQARKETERRIQEKAKKRDNAFNEMYQRVAAGMEMKDGITKEVDDALVEREASKEKKKRELYGTWKEEVYDKIHNQIDAAVNGLSSKDVEAKLIRAEQAFLRASNKFGGVFRDIVIESDYDPLSYAEEVIKINTGRIRDPVKRDVQRQQEEERFLNADNLNVNEEHPRETLDHELWDRVAISYARYEMDTVAPEHLNAARSESTVELDHYNVAKGRDVMLAELPPMKGMKDKNTSHAEIIARKATKGDLWLESKGKKSIPLEGAQVHSNEMFDAMGYAAAKMKELQQDEGRDKGRRPFAKGHTRNMFDVVGHNHDPGSVVTGGDWWLEAKGKQRLENVKQTNELNEIMDHGVNQFAQA